jgi:hypothetical protein
VLADPLSGAEDAVIAHPWWVVAGLAAVAAASRVADRRPRSRAVCGAPEEVLSASTP